MNTFNRIDFLLRERKLRQIDLTNHLGVPKTHYTDWKNGRTSSYNKYLAQIAEFFGVTVDYLLGNTSQPTSYNYHSSLKGYKLVPVLSIYETPEENPVKYLVGEEPFPISEEDGREYVGLKISDDSMFPSLLPGDTVIIRKQSTAEDGDLVLVKLGSESAIIRQIKKEPSGICLIPRNPLKETVFISNAEAERLSFSICGVVIELRRTIK